MARLGVVVALFGLSVAACTGGGDGGASADDVDDSIAPLGPGVVTVPAWFDDPEVLDVSRTAEPAVPIEPLRGLAAAGAPVVVLSDGSDDPADWIVASYVRFDCLGCLQGDPSSSAGRAASFTDDDPYGVGRCGSRSLHVDLGGRVLVVGSPSAADAELSAVADGLAVDADSALVGDPPAGWSEIGRLELGWRQDPLGTVAAIDGEVEVRVRRVEPAQATVFEALTCPDPRRDLGPPTSVDPSVYDGQEPRTIRTAVGPARVGVVGTGLLAVVAGDRLALVRASYRPSFPSDGELGELVGGIEAMPEEAFDAAAVEHDRAKGDAAVAATVAAGVAVVADVEAEGQRIVVVALGTAAEPLRCAFVARSADGYRSGPVQPAIGGACVDGADVGDPTGLDVGLSTDGLGPFHLLAAIGTAVDRVQVVDAAGRIWEAVLADVGTGQRVAVAAVPSVSVRGVTGSSPSPGAPPGAAYAETVVGLFGGPVVVQALDAAGAVVAEATLGA